MDRRKGIHHLGQAALDLLLPPRCPACNLVSDTRHTGGFCDACWQSVVQVTDACRRCGQPETGALCRRCRRAPPPFVGAGAPLVYGGQLALAIQRVKYGGASHLCGELGRFMSRHLQRLQHQQQLQHPRWAIPVPLHRRRLAARGFNQAALLARAAVRGTGIGVHFDLLRRVRDTPSQAGLDHEQRRRNLAGAFVVPAARRRQLSGRDLLLVDDVMTTGATAAACAQALLEAGARRVHVLTLARAVP
jgi:ComF family protein